jgi:hypothetical protein
VPVLTQHNDNWRTGAFLNEKRITVASLGAQGMRLIVPPIDVGDDIETQVLYVPRVPMHTFNGASLTNVAIVTTIGNNVFAIDTDTGAKLWTTKLTRDTSLGGGPGGIHSTPVIDPEMRYLYVVYRSTDRTTSGNTAGQSSFWLARLDLLTGAVVNDAPIKGDYANPDPHPSETVPFKSAANKKRPDPLTHETITFTASAQHNRPGLLLTPSGVYVAFGAYNERDDPYHGWVFQYHLESLNLLNNFCTTPDHYGDPDPDPVKKGGGAAGIWQSGGGLASDDRGNVYFATGNGPSPSFHASPGSGRNLSSQSDISVTGSPIPRCPSIPNNPKGADKGNTVLRLNPDLSMGAQYEIPLDDCFSGTDLDLGSGGVLLIPNMNRVVAGGKPGKLYLLQTQPEPKTQKLPLINQFQAFYNTYVAKSTKNINTEPPYSYELGSNPHMHGTPVYWQGPDPSFANVFAWAEKDYLKSFKLHRSDGNFDKFALDDTRCPPQGAAFLCNGLAGNQYAPGTNNPQMPGGMLSLSANGSVAGTGVLWAVLRTVPNYYGPPNSFRDVLLAYDAQTLKLIWQDTLPSIPKWAVPTVADGKVLIGSAGLGTHSLSIYELRLGSPAAVRASASSDTSPVKVTWAIDDPGTDAVDVEVQGAKKNVTLGVADRSYVLPSMTKALNSSLRVCSHKGSEQNCSPWVQPLETTKSTWLDVTKAELDQTGWGLTDLNSVNWARASRAAFGFCTFNGFVGGQFNGYQAIDDDGVLQRAAVVCHGSEAKFFDSTSEERNALRPSGDGNFTNVDSVQWSVASRMAADYCVARHYAGGQFDGNQTTNPAGGVLMGIVCYGGEWKDASRGAKEFGFNEINDPVWAEAARAGYDWCRQLSTSAGADAQGNPITMYYPLGGRLNGYESDSTSDFAFGDVCYSGRLSGIFDHLHR